MRSRNQRSWLMTTAQPAKLSSASSSARSVSTSRSLVGSSSSSRLRALLQQLGEVDAVALAARQGADLALLLRALEVEPGDVGARRDLRLPIVDLVLAAGDLFPDALVRRQRVAALVDVAELHRLAEPQRAGVRLFRAGDHPEQRRLAGAVRADDADDAAGRQREVEVVDQQLIAVRLAQAAGFDDDVAEARTGRDVDLDLVELLRRILVEQLFVGVEAGLALGLAGARRHADPLQLALERLLPLASPTSLPAPSAPASARARRSSCPSRGCRAPRSSSRIHSATLSRK